MIEILNPILVIGLILLWVILVSVVGAFLLRKRANRIVICSSIGIITGFVAFLAMISNSDPSEPISWQACILLGLGVFMVSLLWSYLTPWLKGTTWDQTIEDALQKTKSRKRY